MHWDFATVVNLDHAERQKWCGEISKINGKLNGDRQKSLLDI